ncbi:BREX-3 system P-loop-containing protein BrxF [Micromonospora sp. NPDC007208]|uniref:BREX-3 system P-loop-containing protein BrxF n=1 Tax=Micromonospora sp. NPDC007208 TaxID=3364236 RepID=UPI00367AC17A
MDAVRVGINVEVQAFAEHHLPLWPRTGHEVWAELRSRRGVALITPPSVEQPDADAAAVASLFASLVHDDPVPVGLTLAAFDHAPADSEVFTALLGHAVLTDLDVLFDVDLHLDPLRLLRRLAASRAGVVAVWPGSVQGANTRYASPGHRDYFEARLSECLLLHPRSTVFDDQAPFDLERLP